MKTALIAFALGATFVALLRRPDRSARAIREHFEEALFV